MLLLFKRNDIIGFLVLAVVAFLLRLVFFVNPPQIAALGEFEVTTFGHFAWLRNWYLNSSFTFLVLSTIVWLLFSIYFKQSVADEKFLSRRDFMPAFALILITASLPQFIILSAPLFSAFFVYLSFSFAIGTPYNKAAHSRYFNIGFFMGVAIVFYWPAIIAIPAILIILLGMRLFVLQEILAYFFGILLPLYLIFSLYYVFVGKTISYADLALKLHLPVSWTHVSATILLIALLILVTFYGLYISRNNMADNKIQLIKRWNSLVIYLVVSILIGFTTTTFPGNAFVFVLIPFSIILSSALTNNLSKYNTFTFYLVLIAVLSVQWVLRFL